jgi:enoyl-CoA hydratase
MSEDRHDTGTEMLGLQVERGIATLTFDNQARRNALSAEIREALPSALRWLASTDAVRLVVITGAGDRAFVSGADISEFGEGRTSAESRERYDSLGTDISRAWAALEKPIIARIRGYCIGGGLLTALEADLRVAADDSVFAVPAVRLGVGYSRASVDAVVNCVGPVHAAEILLTGRRLDAREALRVGLVHRVVPVADLDAEIASLGELMLGNAPMTMRSCKVAIRAWVTGNEELRRRADDLVEQCFRSDDYQEGQRAFAERRPPQFSGR